MILLLTITFIFNCGYAESPAQFLKKGKVYYKHKSWDKALEYFKKANNPTNPEALEWISKACEQKKDYLEQIRALEILIHEKPNIPKYYTQLGTAYLNSEKIPKAIENYKEAIKRAPKYEKAYVELLEVYKKQKNYYEAAILLNDVMNVFGKTERWLSKLCEIKTLQSFYDDAKLICQDAVSRLPRVAENHVYLALAYKNSGAAPQAEKIMLSAGRQFKKSELAQFYAGQFSDESKNWEQSIIFYGQGAKVDPKSTRCHLGLAQALYEINEYAKSLAAFSKACALDNNVDNEIRKYAGLLRMKNKNDWYSKFKIQADRCSVLRSKESKTLSE